MRFRISAFCHNQSPGTSRLQHGRKGTGVDDLIDDVIVACMALDGRRLDINNMFVTMPRRR